MNQWYVLGPKGERRGPLSEAALAREVREGSLTPDSFIEPDDGGAWCQVKTLPAVEQLLNQSDAHPPASEPSVRTVYAQVDEAAANPFDAAPKPEAASSWEARGLRSPSRMTGKPESPRATPPPPPMAHAHDGEAPGALPRYEEDENSDAHTVMMTTRLDMEEFENPHKESSAAILPAAGHPPAVARPSEGPRGEAPRASATPPPPRAAAFVSDAPPPPENWKSAMAPVTSYPPSLGAPHSAAIPSHYPRSYRLLIASIVLLSVVAVMSLAIMVYLLLRYPVKPF